MSRLLKKTVTILSSSVFCLAASYVVMSPAAEADVLYNNGAVNGELNAFSIDIAGGFSVADSFTLGSNSNVNGVGFAVWVISGETPTTVDWAITTSPFSGVIASGTSASLTGNDLGTNGTGIFDVFNESLSGLNVDLAAGNYWLQFSNAGVSTAGDPVYWDENDGPSQAFQTPNGTAASDYSLVGGLGGSCPTCSGSETFEVLGSVPEPGTVTMLLSGFLLASPALYKARRKAIR
jgi:hypothetical protein